MSGDDGPPEDLCVRVAPCGPGMAGAGGHTVLGRTRGAQTEGVSETYSRPVPPGGISDGARVSGCCGHPSCPRQPPSARNSLLL